MQQALVLVVNLLVCHRSASQPSQCLAKHSIGTRGCANYPTGCLIALDGSHSLLSLARRSTEVLWVFLVNIPITDCFYISFMPRVSQVLLPHILLVSFLSNLLTGQAKTTRCKGGISLFDTGRDFGRSSTHRAGQSAGSGADGCHGRSHKTEGNVQKKQVLRPHDLLPFQKG